MLEPTKAPAIGTIPTTPNSWDQQFRLALLDRDVQRLLVNVALILLIGTFTHVVGGGKFLTIRNIDALVVQISVMTIIACAMTLVMVAGAIDISVSGTVVLSGVVAGLLIVNGMPMWAAFAIAILTVVVVGLINSFLVIVIGITSLIATIGSLYVAQGVANLLTNGLPVIGLPRDFSYLGSGFVAGVPVSLPIMIGVVAILIAIQKFTRFGRYTVATGSNAQAAFLNGVNIRRTLTLCFMVSGAAAGWGGAMYASRIGYPTPVVDNDLLFQITSPSLSAGPLSPAAEARSLAPSLARCSSASSRAAVSLGREFRSHANGVVRTQDGGNRQRENVPEHADWKGRL